MGDDPIGVVFALMILLGLVTFVPMLIVQNNVDAQSRSTVEALAQDFTDNARSAGYITREEYQIFKNALSTTGYSFHIEMLHESKIVIPDESSYIVSYNAYNFEDILNELDENGIYEMKNGDTFSIKLTSVTPTYGSSELAALIGGSGQKMTIPAGGMVGNSNR